ncbi:MAG: hypothetical protein ABS46_15515 [Cytophagaceae bacterium SCN 52-12]|nr:MAG: hypothetical protein ABS46_15515 [Cytophagaceae bacterium SCN 52-12]
MKKVILSLAIIVGVSFAAESFAGEGSGDKEIKLFPLKDARFRLAFSSPDQRSLISIKDESGRILYNETVARNIRYLKIFDFSTLGDGKYTLEVSSGKNKISKPFEVQTSTTRFITATTD